jgi:hypothetical protein
MRSVIVTSALLIALGTGVGVIATQHQRNAITEQTVGVGVDPGRWTSGWVTHAPLIDDFDHEEATGSVGLFPASRLWLTDEERGFVFLGVINLPDVPDAPIKAPGLASELSQTVALHDIPAMVIRKIPQLSDYKFVKLDDRILLVGASNRTVAEVIPRYKLIVH